VRAQEAAARLRAHLRGCIDERENTPDDVPDDVLQRVIDQTRSNAGPGRPLDGPSRDAIASHLLGLLSGSIVATIGTFLGAIDVLVDLPAARLRELREVCQDPGHTERLDRWVDEACRLGGAYPPMLYRIAAQDVALTPEEPEVHLVARGALVVSVPYLANFDLRCFERPWRFEPERFEGPSPAPKPLLFGSGVHRCLAEHLGHTMIREMIRALFARPGVRRLPGAEGHLQRGPKGTIPGGDFARRMLVRFDA
jgi:cytochrome P450